MEIYEKICKVIELYNKYKGNLNDDGTVATNERIAEWIVPSIKDCKEEINEKELDRIAIEEANKISLLNPKEGKNVAFYKGYKAGYRI